MSNMLKLLHQGRMPSTEALSDPGTSGENVRALAYAMGIGKKPPASLASSEANVTMGRLAMASFEPIRPWRIVTSDEPLACLLDSIATLCDGGRIDEARVSRLTQAALKQQRAWLGTALVATRALGAAEVGALEEATQLARRASRMARTEAMPQEQYFANIILARIRRLAGRPHLAQRILRSLARVASAPWRPWIDAELVLACGVGTIGGVELPHFIAREWNELEYARSARPLDDAPAPIRSWIVGELADPPPSLSGACSPIGRETTHGGCPTWILGGGTPAGRRILRPKLPSRVDPSLRITRADTAIAILALAPAPLPDQEWFERVYRFSMKENHVAVFKTLRARVRQRLHDAELIRQGGVSSLTGELSLVPDPRCTRGGEELLLDAVAAGAKNAREVASRLQIALRTAQLALRELAEQGVCEAKADGRGMVYEIVDTTFSEPTIVD